jgi:hypothetical protein
MHTNSRSVACLSLLLALTAGEPARADLCTGCAELWQDAPGFDLVGTLANSDSLGRAVAVGDWNGDGFDDVAVFDYENAVVGGAGAVHVLYANFLGVSSSDDYFTDFDPLTGNADEEAGDEFGSALEAGDFDGDGFDDLAIGIPFEDATIGPGFFTNCGAVLVLYGSPVGLEETGAQKLFSSIASDRTEIHFGAALAAGDFDGDGHDDLAVASPDSDVSGHERAGSIAIYEGSASGIVASARLIHQDSSDATGSVSDVAEELDRFGTALVAGNFNGDTLAGHSVDDLAVGVVGEGDAVAVTTGSGIVQVFYGDPFQNGLTFSTDQSWNQGNSASGESQESGDAFGFSLAAGDITGDGRDELVVGSPFESVTVGANSFVQAGMVLVLRGSFPNGLVSGGSVSFIQDDFAVGESSASNDFFGRSLAVADFDGNGLAELVVGTQFEEVVDPITFATWTDAGSILVIPGWSEPFPLDAPRIVAQEYGAHVGALGVGDEYGAALAAGDFDGDGHADLAIGAPGEDATGAGGEPYDRAGGLYVLRGSLFSDGFETGNTGYWSLVAP